ncbi:unnamed protein product [Orchesella dallaii]
MKVQETKRLRWEHRSPQLRQRRGMVSFIMKVCMHERYSSDTTYLAIYLYDRFTDRHSIAECQLTFVSLVCVVLSGKLLEVDHSIPRYHRMTKFISNFRQSQYQTFLGLEKYVLDAFRCDILVPTEINFLQFYMLYAVDGISSVVADENNNSIVAGSDPSKIEVGTNNFAPYASVQGADIVEKIKETAMLILQELSRLDPTNEFPPSWIAASILMFARRENSLNFWTPKLAAITSYTLAEVQCCLVAYIEPRFKESSFNRNFMAPDFRSVNKEVFILAKETTDQNNNN